MDTKGRKSVWQVEGRMTFQRKRGLAANGSQPFLGGHVACILWVVLISCHLILFNEGHSSNECLHVI